MLIAILILLIVVLLLQGVAVGGLVYVSFQVDRLIHTLPTIGALPTMVAPPVRAWSAQGPPSQTPGRELLRQRLAERLAEKVGASPPAAPVKGAE